MSSVHTYQCRLIGYTQLALFSSVLWTLKPKPDNFPHDFLLVLTRGLHAQLVPLYYRSSLRPRLSPMHQPASTKLPSRQCPCIRFKMSPSLMKQLAGYPAILLTQVHCTGWSAIPNIVFFVFVDHSANKNLSFSHPDLYSSISLHCLYLFVI